MKKDPESKTHMRRDLHGCLPLFLLPSVVLIGCGLWLLPVRMEERVRPKGEGKVYYQNKGLVNYEAARKSPLTLRTDADPGGFFYRESEKLYSYVGRTAELRGVPPMDILPLVADSVVITRELLLELPPVKQDNLTVPQPAATGDGEHAQDKSKEVAL